MRFLFFPMLAKISGSAYLAARLQHWKPHMHVFGHTHFSWDACIDGTHLHFSLWHCEGFCTVVKSVAGVQCFCASRRQCYTTHACMVAFVRVNCFGQCTLDTAYTHVINAHFTQPVHTYQCTLDTACTHLPPPTLSSPPLGTRFIQAPLCYPSERRRRRKSLSFAPQQPSQQGALVQEDPDDAAWLPVELYAAWVPHGGLRLWICMVVHVHVQGIDVCQSCVCVGTLYGARFTPVKSLAGGVLYFVCNSSAVDVQSLVYSDRVPCGSTHPVPHTQALQCKTRYHAMAQASCSPACMPPMPQHTKVPFLFCLPTTRWLQLTARHMTNRSPCSPPPPHYQRRCVPHQHLVPLRCQRVQRGWMPTQLRGAWWPHKGGATGAHRCRATGAATTQHTLGSLTTRSLRRG